jgi:hypothetical protein
MLLDHLLGDLAAKGVSVVVTGLVRHSRPVKDQRSRGRGVLAGSRGGQSVALTYRRTPGTSAGQRRWEVLTTRDCQCQPSTI